MITYNEARTIAEAEIYKLNQANYGIKVALLENFEETAFLWIFFFQSEEFIKTGNINYLVGGNSPFLISKLDGTIYQYSTGYSVEQMIELYEDENNCWQLILTDESLKDSKKLSILRQTLDWTMSELNEHRKQNNLILKSGNQKKLLAIQQTLQTSVIMTEIKVNEVFKTLIL